MSTSEMYIIEIVYIYIYIVYFCIYIYIDIYCNLFFFLSFKVFDKCCPGLGSIQWTTTAGPDQVSLFVEAKGWNCEFQGGLTTFHTWHVRNGTDRIYVFGSFCDIFFVLLCRAGHWLVMMWGSWVSIRGYCMNPRSDFTRQAQRLSWNSQKMQKWPCTGALHLWLAANGNP